MIEIEKIFEIAKVLCPSVEIYEHRGQFSLIVNSDFLFDLALELRDNPETDFDMLTDITAIDWLGKQTPRFEVVYFLWSNNYKTELRIKVPVKEQAAICPSVTKIWESANWYERETYDMYGIRFIGHPFLRRFYMPEDISDPVSGEALFPLRKDFPMMGIPNSMPLPPYPEKYGEEK